MNFSELPFYKNRILFGYDNAACITAVEIDESADPCKAVIFSRRNGQVERSEDQFHPFILVKTLSYLEGFTGEDWYYKELAGGNDLKYVVYCTSYSCTKRMLAHLKKVTGSSYGSPSAPYYYLSDLVSQYLTLTGKTLFKGMTFEDLHRMQIDIETYCAPGYEFPHAERPSDRVVIIAMSDSTGWSRIISGVDLDEPTMIKEMIKEINERDPDVLEGHNFHKFDLEYLATRAKMHKLKLTIGRDKSVPKPHPSRMNIAERTIVYPKYEVYGRHVIDTWLLAQLYDVSARELESYGLKDIAAHFKVAPADRVYIDAFDIPRMFDCNPEILTKYALDDVTETNEISKILSPPYFIQTQIFPFSYQNVTVRGNATRIDSLFIREYIRKGYSIPQPPQSKVFTGAYTDIFTEGVIENVIHVDVASLYPSIMLAFGYFPPKDDLHIFESLLEDLRHFRLEAKGEARNRKDPHERDFYNALQQTFKILINSFYGYLGFPFGHFSDFEMAEATTSKGREIVKMMVEWLKEHNCRLIELDTDGIYFNPPDGINTIEGYERLVEELNSSLPKGIKLELDGVYKAMFSYKMKNYILLDFEGNMYIKGSGLKSRGLEYFQRKFIEEMFELLLNGRTAEIDELLKSYQNKIINHEWDVRWFQKSDTLQESLDAYKDKISQGARNPAAVYELAIQSGRDYQAGDQISYYVTGTKATVTAYKNAKFAYQWDKNNPDENVKYYASKLNDLYKKFKKYF